MGWGRNIVASCGIMDLGYDGYSYTWTNGIQGSDNTQCRLDMALASPSFINRYSPIEVQHLSRFQFDHAAISISLEAELSQNNSKGKRTYKFLFEKAWSKDPRCEGLVEQL